MSKLTHHQSKTTTNHKTIRKWAEERGARPATVKSTEGKDGEARLLRLDFPGYSGTCSLVEITWEEFFEKFEEAKLAFEYQEETAEGEKSNFNKILSRIGKINCDSGRFQVQRAHSDRSPHKLLAQYGGPEFMW